MTTSFVVGGGVAKTAEWDGRTTFYVEAGDPARPAVVFIHGYGTSHYAWRHQIPALARTFHVFAPDLLGFGDSSKPRDIAYTPELWVGQLTTFLEHACAKPVAVVGHSLGGLLAGYLAERRPDLVNALVMVASAGAATPLQSVLVNFPFVLMRTPVLGRRFFELVMQRRFIEWNIRNRLYVNPAAVTPELVEFYQHALFDPENFEIVFEVMKGFHEYVMTDEMTRRITQPTMILWGKRDTFVLPTRGEQLHRLIPNSELHILPDAAHCPHEDQPDEVNRRLLDFLGRIP